MYRLMHYVDKGFSYNFYKYKLSIQYGSTYVSCNVLYI